ncbi:hypothetical protein PGB90_005874 [Kerria lacca]
MQKFCNTFCRKSYTKTRLSLRSCSTALGMEKGHILDSAITASSSYDPKSVGPQNARQLRLCVMLLATVLATPYPYVQVVSSRYLFNYADSHCMSKGALFEVLLRSLILFVKCRQTKLSYILYICKCGFRLQVIVQYYLLKMSGSSRKMKNVISIEQKLKALQRVDGGMSVVAVASSLGDAKSMVSMWKKNRSEIGQWCLARPGM